MAWKPVNGLTKFTVVLTNRAFLKVALFYYYSFAARARKNEFPGRAGWN